MTARKLHDRPAARPGHTQPALEDTVTMTPAEADRVSQTRADLEAGFTEHEWAVGMVICPAGEQCESGPVAVFEPLKDGRLPMHRGWLNIACEGSRKKPTTPPLRLRTA